MRDTPVRARWLLLLALLGLLATLAVSRSAPEPLERSAPDLPPPQRSAGLLPTEPEAATATKSDKLHIWLRDVEDTRFVWSVPGQPFDEVWPDDGDERWDTAWFHLHETPAAIRSLSGPGTPFKGRRGPRVLQVALDEGFGAITQPATPEEALVALYTAWVEAEVRFEQDWDVFEAQHLPDGLTRADLAAPELRKLYALPGKPVQDLRRLGDLAELALDTWPEHPLADHAHLALLRAERPYGVHPWDVDAMAELLDRVESPVLRERAALLVTNIREPGPELLDRVFDIEASNPVDAYRLASWGMARAVETRDWERATAWAQRAREAVDTVCELDVAIAVSDCEFGSYQLRETTARLVALGHQQPVTWQEALTAAAWRCHLRAPAEPGRSRTDATWTGERWVFDPWDHISPVTACLDKLGTTEVVPDEPMHVRLTVEADG